MQSNFILYFALSLAYIETSCCVECESDTDCIKTATHATHCCRDFAANSNLVMRHRALGIFAPTITNVVEDVVSQTNVRIVLNALIIPNVIKRRFAVGNTRLINMDNVLAIAMDQSAEYIKIALN